MAKRIQILLITAVAALAFSGCSRSPQAKQARFMEAGKKQLEKKDYNRAVLEFKNAIQALPKEPEPYYQLGLAYLGSGDLRAAIFSFRKCVELNPKHAGAQLKLAEIMALSPNKEVLAEAEKRAADVLASAPDNVDALNTLALTELRLGKAEDAEEHLKEALQKFPAHLRSSVALAQLKLNQRDLKGAEEVMKQAVAQAPKSPAPAETLGQLYAVLGRTAEAEQQFRAALAIDPKYGRALRNLGAIQIKAGRNAEAEQTYKQLAALPDKEYKPLYALFLFRAGKTEAAVAEFERLAREDAGDRDARTRLVKAYLAVNRVADAEKVLGDALKKNAKDVDALLERSKIYLAGGKYTEAQNDLNQVLRFRKDSAEAHHVLSKVHQARGDAANRQHELSEALRANRAYLPARLELAQILIATNAAKSALNLLSEAPENQKNSLAVAVQRNWALLANGDRAQLRKEIDRILGAARVPDVLVQDAALKLGQSDFAGARAALEEVLKRNPADLRALDLLVRTYAGQKQFPAGVQKIREYAAQAPKSAAVQQFLGRLLVESGNLADARKSFEAAKAAAPGYLPAELALAQLDIQQGNGDAARKNLTALLAGNTGKLEAHLMLGSLDTTGGNHAAAIEHYRKVLEIDSRNIGALNNLAYLLVDNANQPDEALKYAQQAKEIAPDSPAIDDTLGWIYFHKGIYLTAVKHLESATAKQGTALRRYHLAMAYLKAGDYKRGQQTLDAAVKLDPKLPEAQAARRLLAEVATKGLR